MEAGVVEEVEFVAAIEQLQKVHKSRVVELQSLCDEQVQLNVQIQEEVEQLKDKVKKLKSVVHASKIKISQQAQIIAEQTILLRKARSPSAFQLSELYRDSEDQFPDSEQTDLPPLVSHHVSARPTTEQPRPRTTAEPENIVKPPPVHRHMIYSHAHSNLNQTSRTNGNNRDSTKRNKSLSLKGEEGARVRYKERDSGNGSTANRDSSGNGLGRHIGDHCSDSDKDSRTGSPPFLTDPSNLNTSSNWECAGTKDNPMEVDEPMSCSMFHTYVQTSTCEPKDFMTISMSTPRKRKKNLEEIADQLNSSKKVEKQSLKRNLTDPNILPVTPEIKSKISNPNIVPITPGVKSVDLILNGKKNTSAVKSGKAGDARLKAESDENIVTSASDISKDPVRKSRRLAAGSSTKSANTSGNEAALKVAKRMGLPTDYKCETKILKKSDRDKLDAKACPDCQKWYEGDQRALKHTCRHKHLYMPPDSDSRMWDISFPNTEEYEDDSNI